MRIIAGKYKGRSINSPTEETVRPPLTRFRRAVFDTLMPFLHRGEYLDLFGGSGSFTFEALSRDAPAATVIELNPKTAQLIQRNAQKIQIQEPLTLHRGDSLKWIPKIAQQQKSFAVIAVAPPYHQGLENTVMALLDQHPSLLQEDGIIFLQHPTEEKIQLEWKNFEHWKTKKYGYTSVSYFFRR